MNRLYLIIIIVLIFVSLSATDYYDSRGLDTIAYVVAIGVDKGTENKLKLSLQFAILNNSGSDSSTQSQESTITTVECSTINSGLNLINSYISKNINLAHCKAIVFSEELAYLGLSDYICTFANNVEIRPNCDIIISKSSAEDFLNSSKPTLENLSARYYEVSLSSSKYTGFTEEVVLSDFFINMFNQDSQSYAILGGINSKETQSNFVTPSTYSEDESYTADQVPIIGETQIENMGLAIFKGDKLVGELTGIDSICHAIITNKLDKAVITIPSPFEELSSISLEIFQEKHSSSSIKLINNFPYIDVCSYVNARILSLSNNIDYTKKENLNKVSEYLTAYLQSSINSYLYKTSKEYKSDIDGFGKQIRKNYLTLSDFYNSDWLNNYENSFFKVNTYCTVLDSYLFTNIS